MRPLASPLATPRRIGYCGDWHMNASWASQAIRYAAEQGADVVIHLGDYGYTFDAVFMAAVDEALGAAGIPLLFVDGNHENFPALHRYPVGADGLRQLTDHVWHLPRGFRWEWSGRRYLALGGAHSVDRPWRRPGVSWWAEETISTQDAAYAVAGGPADVLISHDCPAGVPIPGLGEGIDTLFPLDEIARAIAHRDVLRGVVDKVRPTRIWHGHYHTRYDVTADLGYGPVRVTGLDCDESDLASNALVVEVTAGG